MPKLVCLSGMTKGDEYSLPEGETFMGRSESNDICIFDNLASRIHCKIVNVDGEISLVDNNSTNGVMVNDEPLNGSIKLNVEDKIKIGYTIYQISNVDPNATHTKLNSLLKNVKTNRVSPPSSLQKTKLKINI